jgi:pimeloyl-ACP methyl ester carboxylesterase
VRRSWPLLAVLGVAALGAGAAAGAAIGLAGSAASATTAARAPATSAPTTETVLATAAAPKPAARPPARRSRTTPRTVAKPSGVERSSALPYRTIPDIPGAVGIAPLRAALDRLPLTRLEQIAYRSHTGAMRMALVLFPRRPPAAPLPLVIAIHGRGGDPTHACAAWGDLPGYARIVVVCPEGQGRLLDGYSWGDAGQIDDLARMPQIVTAALPALRLAPRRTFAVGASMGGQETLLLVARHPGLLAGAVAIDPVVNLISRYDQLSSIPGGPQAQALMRSEVGGTPQQVPNAYALRSPVDFVPQIANARTRLAVWWSSRDWIVHNQRTRQSGIFLQALARTGPRAPVSQRVGTWMHSWPYLHELWAVLGELGLLSRHGFPTPLGTPAVVSRGSDPALRG